MFQRLGVRARIGGGFAVLIGISLIMAAVGYMSLGSVWQSSQKSSDAHRLLEAALEISGAEKSYIIHGDQTYIDSATETVEEMNGIIDRLQLTAGQEERLTLQSVSEQLDAWFGAFTAYANADMAQRNLQSEFEYKELEFLNGLSSIVSLTSLEVTSSIGSSDSSNAVKQFNTFRKVVDAISEANALGKNERGYMMSLAQATKQEEQATALDSSLVRLQVLLGTLSSSLSSDRQRDLASLKLTEAQYLETIVTSIAEQEALKETQEPTMEASYANLEALVSEYLVRETAAADAMRRRAGDILIYAALAAFVLGGIMAFVISRSITAPLSIIMRAANAGAAGDLTQTAAIKRRDEIGKMSVAFNQMVANLRDIAYKVTEAAEATAATSQQLSASSQEASASIEEVTSAADQFSATTEGLSQNAQSMAKSATEVSELAQSGLSQMNSTEEDMQGILNSSLQAKEAIGGLSTASSEIDQIVGFISDIADQTNLLALNAAIEAARAGDAGRGFAVVADEVRKLAEETQRSANEIRGIVSRLTDQTHTAVRVIDRNNDQIQAGARSLNTAGTSFKKIVSRIQNIVGQITEVTNNVEQMSNGSRHILSATQEQASSMQQISSSSQQLASMADELRRLVEQLKVE